MMQRLLGFLMSRRKFIPPEPQPEPESSSDSSDPGSDSDSEYVSSTEGQGESDNESEGGSEYESADGGDSVNENEDETDDATDPDSDSGVPLYLQSQSQSQPQFRPQPVKETSPNEANEGIGAESRYENENGDNASAPESSASPGAVEDEKHKHDLIHTAAAGEEDEDDDEVLILPSPSPSPSLSLPVSPMHSPSPSRLAVPAPVSVRASFSASVSASSVSTPRSVSVSFPFPIPLIKPLPLALPAPPSTSTSLSSSRSPSPSSSSSPRLSPSEVLVEPHPESEIPKPQTPEPTTQPHLQLQAETQPQTPESVLMSSLKEAQTTATGDGATDREPNLDDLPVPQKGEEILGPSAFRRQFLSKELGEGLVATQDIRAGSIIFADALLTVWSDEKVGVQTIQEANDMLKRKGMAYGYGWLREFLLLSGTNEEFFGTMGGIWEAHHLPVAWAGKQGGAIGLNLASINHSCVPNCVLNFQSLYPVDADGTIRYDKRPRLGLATVRACVDIRAGVEICISYMPVRGNVQMRRKELLRRFGFRCVCRVCSLRHRSYERAFTEYDDLADALNDRFVVADRPAQAFKIAHDTILALNRLFIQDYRFVMIFMKCALIAGHHSDLARAHCFLSRARKLALMLQGPGGELTRQLRNWYVNPTLMPGFGGTLRGLSTLTEALDIYRSGRDSMQILFMIGADPGEYIRVSRYVCTADQICADCCKDGERDRGRGKKGDREKESTCEVREGLDPVPPKLDINKEKPISEWCSQENCESCARTEHRENKMRESQTESADGSSKKTKNKKNKNKKKKKKKAKKKPQSRSTKDESSTSCGDPEKDFLDCFLGVVDDFYKSKEESGGWEGKNVGGRRDEWYINTFRKGSLFGELKDEEILRPTDPATKTFAKRNPKKAALVVRQVGAVKKVLMIELEDEDCATKAEKAAKEVTEEIGEAGKEKDEKARKDEEVEPEETDAKDEAQTEQAPKAKKKKSKKKKKGKKN